MNLISYFAILLAAFSVTFLVTPLVRQFAVKAGLVDKPDPRKVHKIPVPRVGGIAIFAGCMVTVFVSSSIDGPLAGILLGASVIFITGILDDIYSLNPFVKLGGQILAACITWFFGVSISFVTNPFGGLLYIEWIALPLTIIWIVGMINTMNLIDGLDGLAAGLAAISAFTISRVALNNGQVQAAVLAIALVGACLGFLRYNFSPAQIFMGDTGSMFLGYMIATMSIFGVLKSTITISLFVPILVLGVPISDTFFAIFRRIKNKKGIFQPDRGHFHHILIDLGLSHKQAVLFFYATSVVLGLLAYSVSLFSGYLAYLLLAAILIAIAAFLYLLKEKHGQIFSIFRVL